MKGRISIALFSLFAALFMPFQAMAAEQITPPNFPTCGNPEGSQIASYNDGSHGIAGDQNSYTGKDSVYSLNEGNALQCFCNGNSGVQTNWWNVGELSQDEIQNLENQGWVYVPNGADWGLSDSAYMAYNIYGSCGGGSTPNNNPGNPGGGSTDNTCTDTAPSSAPFITNISYGQNSATLSWNQATNPVTGYFIKYGTQPGNYSFASGNVGNVTTYTINNLSGGTTYYFIVYAVNGCKPGPFSNEVNTAPTGGQVSGIATGFNEVTPTPTPSASVEGTSTQVGAIIACTRCFWWPILVVEGIILVLGYFLLKKRKMSMLARFSPGAAVAVLAYVFFVLYNGGKCPFGVMDFKLFVIPCKYFWAVDGVLYLAIAFIFKPKTSKKK